MFGAISELDHLGPREAVDAGEPEREVRNGEIAFIVDWDEEEGDARLSLDDGEREIVVPDEALDT
jgi:hypothetical protein